MNQPHCAGGVPPQQCTCLQTRQELHTAHDRRVAAYQGPPRVTAADSAAAFPLSDAWIVHFDAVNGWVCSDLQCFHRVSVHPDGQPRESALDPYLVETLRAQATLVEETLLRVESISMALTTRDPKFRARVSAYYQTNSCLVMSTLRPGNDRRARVT